MDEQLAYDECDDEKRLIGNLLADDDNYSPTKEVRNVQRSTPGSFYQTSNLSFYPPTYDTRNWGFIPLTPVEAEWTPPTNLTLPSSNGFPESCESFRYSPLSLSFSTNHARPPPPKPTATVLPFQNIDDSNKSDETPSPVSDERVSDSGTISPDVRPKPIKWKKVDLASIENSQKQEIFTRQNSETMQQQNGKSYSSVAQGQQQPHKRLSATSSVPLSKPQVQKNPHTTKKGPSHRTPKTATTTPTTPEEAPSKPSKIVGLNPINTTTAARVPEPQKTPVPQTPPIPTPTAAPDFQKIKRKKKGKTNSKKLDSKQADEQKAGSRYKALIHSDFTNSRDFLLENGPSEDEDEDFDECEYQRQEEEQKEQIRQHARQQFANEKVSEEEANEKMKKLENEIRVIFEKRKTAKQQRISSQRHRRRKTGYQLVFPTILGSITSVIGSAIYQSFLFFFNLVANVMILSYHALTDSIKTMVRKMFEIICAFVVLTWAKMYQSSCNFLEQIKKCDFEECQIGLSANAPYPLYCEDVLDRLFECPNADAFSILGLTKDATIEEIHTHFKKQITVINPDKRYNVGCEDAFILIQTAYELICSEARKREYLEEVEELPQTYALQIQLDEYRNLISSKGAILHCECGKNHPISRVLNYEGRFCVKCNLTHPVKNGDLWVDKHYFGLMLSFYAVINNTTYNVTEWGKCEANRLKRPKSNPHMITARLYNASANAAVTNVTERHRCSYRPDSCDRIARSIVLPKENLPWKYACCCSLIVCPPGPTYPVHDVPCCFGGIFIAVNTTAAPISAAEKFTDNERARKAGRRRKYR